MRIVAQMPQEGGPRITQNPIFFLKTQKIIKNAKTQKCLEICQNQRYALRPEVSNTLGSVISTMFCKTKSAKKNFFLHGDFRPFPNKNFQMLDHFFPLLFPKDSESQRILDIRLWEVGAKRPVKGTSKVKKLEKKNFFFCAAILDNFKQKCSYLRPLLSITFPQGS